MGWFFGRRKPQGIQPSSLELEDGSHPSPGLEVLWATLRRSPPRAILDLGASSTENLRFLSTFTDNLAIIDLFRGAREADGARASVFSFDSEIMDSLPAGGEKFDVVLLWDLLHYFDRSTFHRFEERLVTLCHPRTLVHLLAANHAEVPLTPMRFKLEEQDSLCYSVPVGERAPGARLTTREVEIRLSRFDPWRMFQLRNGLQEFLFRLEPGDDQPLPERSVSADAGPGSHSRQAMAVETPGPAPEAPELPDAPPETEPVAEEASTTPEPEPKPEAEPEESSTESPGPQPNRRRRKRPRGRGGR